MSEMQPVTSRLAGLIKRDEAFPLVRGKQTPPLGCFEYLLSESDHQGF